MLYGPVLEYLPQGGSLPTANNGHPLRAGVGEHGRVNEGLVVGGVAPGGRLQDAVQEDEAVGKKQLRVTALVRVDSGIQAALILAAGGVEGGDNVHNIYLLERGLCTGDGLLVVHAQNAQQFSQVGVEGVPARGHHRPEAPHTV